MAKHFNKPPLTSKHLTLLSIPALKLPIPFPSSFTSPSPIPPTSFPHIHTPHTQFPTKHFFSGPHAGWIFLMTLMPTAHQHDATNPMTFSASSSQPGTHTPREKEAHEKGKGKRLKNMYSNPCSSSVWLNSVLPQKLPEITSIHGFCKEFWKVHRVVLQIKSSNGWRVKVKSWSKQQSPGNVKKHPLVLELGGKGTCYLPWSCKHFE